MIIKKLLKFHFLPLVISLGLCYIAFIIFSPRASLANFTKTTSEKQTHQRGYYHNLSTKVAQVNFLASLKSTDQITIFGSSEFSESPFCSYYFLPDSSNIKTVGFGHEGNQHFTIFSELLYGQNHLKNSKVVIIISPTWFDTEGTHPKAFLEFVNKNMMASIINNSQTPIAYKAELGKYISSYIHDFNGITNEMEILVDIDKKLTNPVSRLSASIRTGMKNKFKSRYKVLSEDYQVELLPTAKNQLKVDYKTIKDMAQNNFVNSVTNNKMFVYNNYYSKYIEQADGSIKRGNLDKVDPQNSPEFNDFKKVLHLLSNEQVDASFIILPVNPYYYKNPEDYQPLINALESKIKSADLPVLNLFSTDTSTYQPGTLKDVMHLGDYGWLRVNQFINNTYYE